MQSDLQVRLLALFSDLGMRVRVGGPGVVSAMGNLLPAVAASCEGLAAARAAEMQLEQQEERQGDAQEDALQQTQQLGVAASSRFNYDDFARAQREDGVRIKVRVCVRVLE